LAQRFIADSRRQYQVLLVRWQPGPRESFDQQFKRIAPGDLSGFIGIVRHLALPKYEIRGTAGAAAQQGRAEPTT
jgi:hypothetical protein